MAKTCIFEGCEKRNSARGYCQGHAAQLRRGRPLAPLGRQKPTVPEGFSWCSQCKQQKSLQRFPWDKTRDQPQRVCHDCRAAYMREYNARNRERINESVQLRGRGITKEEYNARLAAQGGACALCQKPWDRRLEIDHSHVTERVRGLLCGPCNRAIAFLHDDPKVLRRAADYVESEGWNTEE